jgi:hypothetical protein
VWRIGKNAQSKASSGADWLVFYNNTPTASIFRETIRAVGTINKDGSYVMFLAM